MKKFLSVVFIFLILISSFPIPAFVSAAGEEQLLLNMSDATIYFEYYQYQTDLPIPQELPVSVKIEALNLKQGETLKFEFYSNSISVTADGVVKGNATIYNTEDSTRSFTVVAYTETRWAAVNITLIDYAWIYVEAELDRVAAEIGAKYENDNDRLWEIGKYVASFAYGPGTSPDDFIIFGKGDCIASTQTICYLAQRLGMRARMRKADYDSGAGSNHYNAVVETNGIPRIVEAGYTRTAGEYDYAVIRSYPNGYILSGDPFYRYSKAPDSYASDEIAILEYIGFDSEVVIPSTLDGYKVVGIGADAFRRNDIEKITVSEGIRYLYTHCFYTCGGLKELSLPSTLELIPQLPFLSADNLEKVVIAEQNPYFKTEDQFVLSKDGKKLIYCFPAAKDTLTVPDSVEIIGEYSFYGCNAVTTVNTGKNTKQIDKYAFASNSNLGIIVISEGTETIGANAFASSNIYSVIIPRSVTEIDSLAFKSGLSILGYTGSFAEQFAKEKNITFLNAEYGIKEITINDRRALAVNTADGGMSCVVSTSVNNTITAPEYKLILYYQSIPASLRGTSIFTVKTLDKDDLNITAEQKKLFGDFPILSFELIKYSSGASILTGPGIGSINVALPYSGDASNVAPYTISDKGEVIWRNVYSASKDYVAFGISDLTLYCTFGLKSLSYTVTATAGLGGTVTGSGIFKTNERVTVTAVTDSGYSFGGWFENDIKVSSVKEFTFTVTGDCTLEARFIQMPPQTYTITVVARTGGSVTGGGTFESGTLVTVTAVPDSGYAFDGWYVTAVNVSNDAEYIFTANENRRVEAKFTKAFKLGDPNNDGAINIFDIMAIRDHVFGKNTLGNVARAAADINKDNTVNIFDIMAIRDHIFGKSLING